jgi:hypothetical protein
MTALTTPSPLGSAALTSAPGNAPRSDDHGWFSWNIARGTAVWSDSVHRLHGYEPGQVAVSSALTFRHKHPDDLYGCVDSLHAGMVEHRLIVHEHRLVDASGQTRSAVLVCRPVSDSQGRVRSLRGFLLATDEQLPPAAGSSGAREAPLVRLLGSAFQVSPPAASVLLAARRPLTARRSSQQQDFARRYTTATWGSDLRRTLEDSLFPLEHLTLEPVDLAA